MITEYKEILIVNEDGEVMSMKKKKDGIFITFSRGGFNVLSHEVDDVIDAIKKVAGDQK
jgi:hypothetical protein